jgi:hypothetical protein
MSLLTKGDEILPLLPDINNREQAKFNRAILELIGKNFRDVREDLESVYGEIWTVANTDQTTLNSAAKIQITDFDQIGESNNTTPSISDDHILLHSNGRYLVIVSVVARNNAAQTHDINVVLYKNNGAVSFDNVHAHRTLSGGITNAASISINGIINGEKNDTLELWADTNAAANRNVTFEDVTFTVIKLKD